MQRSTGFLLSIIALSLAPLHAQSLVLNGDFTENIMGWEMDGTNVTAIWATDNANDSASSGSAEVSNQSTDANDSVVLQQCVPINSGQTCTHEGKARLPSGPFQTVNNQAVMSVR